MTNSNPLEKKRRKPGIQALPEERKRGVTIRFLPEMKDDIYDLRDWLEREGNKGKRLLTQILKHEGKIDELLEKVKVKKEDEASIEAEIKQLKETIQNLENFNAQGRAELQQATTELQQLREQITTLKALFGSTCRDSKSTHPNFHCLVLQQARRLLKIPPSNQSQEYIN